MLFYEDIKPKDILCDESQSQSTSADMESGEIKIPIPRKLQVGEMCFFMLLWIHICTFNDLIVLRFLICYYRVGTSIILVNRFEMPFEDVSAVFILCCFFASTFTDFGGNQ